MRFCPFGARLFGIQPFNPFESFESLELFESLEPFAPFLCSRVRLPMQPCVSAYAAVCVCLCSRVRFGAIPYAINRTTLYGIIKKYHY